MLPVAKEHTRQIHRSRRPSARRSINLEESRAITWLNQSSSLPKEIATLLPASRALASSGRTCLAGTSASVKRALFAELVAWRERCRFFSASLGAAQVIPVV